MIRSVSEKLKSKQGVSLLIALAAFLVAAMVSVTIVSSALTGVKTINDDKANQQAMETLVSAAKLVRSELTGAEIVKTEVYESSETNVDGTVTGRTERHQTGGESYDESKAKDFKILLKSVFDYFYGASNAYLNNDSSYVITDTNPITVKCTDDEIDDVDMTVTIKCISAASGSNTDDASGGYVYDFTATLTNKKYRFTNYVTGTMMITTKTDTETKTDTSTSTTGEGDSSRDTTTTTTTTTETVTTTLSFGTLDVTGIDPAIE
ncbi:MAG: hypothetical protein Q4E57_01760 [Eubacteriales bacterium]|nr:hypothetical protein [Eubacteriales bacterium]